MLAETEHCLQKTARSHFPRNKGTEKVNQAGEIVPLMETVYTFRLYNSTKYIHIQRIHFNQKKQDELPEQDRIIFSTNNDHCE